MDIERTKTMKRYIRKPTLVDTEQYTEFGKLVKGMCNSTSCYHSGNTKPHVHTIHDNQMVILEIDDWVIMEHDGIHAYPCKPDIFKETYEGIDMIYFTRSQTEEGNRNSWSPVLGLDGIIHPNIIDSNGDYFGLESHTISKDGTVTPSVVCPYDNGCNFHEYIRLIGWDKITEKKQL